MNINETITALFETRKLIASCNAELKDLKKEEAELTEKVMAHLEQSGLDKVSIKGVGTVSLAEEIVPQVVDWDSVYQYIKDNDAFYLLQRRMSSPAWREAVTIGGDIKGIEPYKMHKLNVRKAA